MSFEARIEKRAHANTTSSHGSAQRAQLLSQIGDFLLRHDLAVTGENLLRAHAIVSGADATLARTVAEHECKGDRVTQDFLDRHAKPRPDAEQAVEQLRDLTVQLDRSVLQFGECTRSAQEAASNYGVELQRSVDAASYSQYSDTVLSEDILSDFTRVAHIMLDRTRAIEERMKQGEEEADLLRANLEKARADASIDPLTGLPNRRAFQEVFEEQRERAKEQGEPLALAICDIDFFKKVNDRHGHETGDRVIRAVGQALDKISDLCHVARHGGEEFVLLFCDQDVASATLVLDATREQLSKKRFVDRVTKKPIGEVTFSGGVSDALAHEEMGLAMRAADEALYRAKESGRNKIEREVSGAAANDASGD